MENKIIELFLNLNNLFTICLSGGVNNGEFPSPATRPSTGYECGEDALMQETEQSFLRNFGGTPEGIPRLTKGPLRVTEQNTD